MRVIVVQMGARHRYAVPKMLEQAGMLEGLYTDSHAESSLGRLAGMAPNGLASRLPGVRRLRDRMIRGIAPERVRSTDLPAIAGPWLRLLSRNWYGYLRRRDRLFCLALKHWGAGRATAVYSMMGEGLEFLKWAKRQGLWIILDIFINPITHRILCEERKRWPGWEEQDTVDSSLLERDMNRRIELADLLVCPSEAVVDGLRYYPSFSAEKVTVAPYGFSADVGEGFGNPQQGRVLFGGTADLRKGIQYFALAAHMLRGRGHGLRFRVAGSVTERIRSRPETQGLEFLGPLPRQNFLAELRSADVFVLPTLAEGSASVLYEALACGVPVVTTRSAGSVVTDGVEGRIVPERDAGALAEAIEQIVKDRALRDRMSAAALKTAAAYTEERWGERLVAALRQAHANWRVPITPVAP